MKKQVFAFVLSLFFAISSSSIIALAGLEMPNSGAFGSEKTLTWVFDESSCTLTIGGVGEIPDYSHVMSVPWYSYEDKIQSIVIQDGVTQIGDYAFANGYENVTKIVIPESVKAFSDSVFCGSNGVFGMNKIKTAGPIGSGCNYEFGWTYSIPQNAFNQLSSIKNVILPDSIKKIETRAFSGCGITSIDLPSGLQTIEDYAFSLSDLTSIVIPDSVTELGENIFYFCESLKKLELPKNLKIVPAYLCRNSALQEITIPATVIELGDWCFAGTELRSIDIPKGVTNIGNNSFYNCKNLQMIKLPNTVKIIGTASFKECRSLYEILLPTGIEEIKSGTFFGCESLTGISIPNSIKNISSSAFYSCPALKSVYYSGSNLQWDEINIETSGNECLLNATIYYDSVDLSEFSEIGYTIETLISYNEITKEVSFGAEATVFTYQITNQTDMSFLKNLDELIGKNVIVSYRYSPYGNPAFLNRYILSISPANIIYGIMDEIAETSVAVNGITYPMKISNWEDRSSLLKLDVGEAVVLYFVDDTVVDVQRAFSSSGVLNEANVNKVTINNNTYSVLLINNEIPPYLVALDLWCDHTVNYISSGSIILDIELEPYQELYTKKMLGYDTGSRTVFFHDGSQFHVAEAVNVDASLLNTWVTITISTSEMGRELTALKAAKPELNLSFKLDHTGDIYMKDGMYSFNGKDYEKQSNFKIPFTISAWASVPYATQEDIQLMGEENSLALTLEDITVSAADFSGEIEGSKPDNIYPVFGPS